MEKFKAVEKEMKTKAYSKEGLSAASKLDPKEKAKLEACQFLSNMVDELERQIETVEAETESLQVNIRKGKKDTGKSDRIAELERMTERHKWHQGKLELLLRSLENGNVDTEQVRDLEDSIRYYVENNQEVDFMEDDSIYDDLNLEEEEDLYGIPNEADRMSSQDAQSIADDLPDGDGRTMSISAPKPKPITPSEPPIAAVRRPSMQLKSPLPALATLHTSQPTTTNGMPATNMKPAPIPTRAPGEPLKYASAAAAAAASDKDGVGIAPLPPPPGAANAASGSAPTPPVSAARQAATASPSTLPTQPITAAHPSASRPTTSATGSTDGASTQISTKSPALSQASAAVASTEASSMPPTPALEKVEGTTQTQRPVPADEPTSQRIAEPDRQEDDASPATPALTNGDTVPDAEETESIYHLPSSLNDLLESFEATKSEALTASTHLSERFLAASHATFPDNIDAERPQHYKPLKPCRFTPPHYPQEPLPVFDDQRLYSRIDTDTLFYAFYYRQGTYQQYLAAKALKSQSWRFHKQYQTWFQRHEEPKAITEDYEQGTYRFFDYESTW